MHTSCRNNRFIVDHKFSFCVFLLLVLTPPLPMNAKVKRSSRNCNYISFTKLSWPGDSEGTFRSSSQVATCPPVYHTRWRLHTVPCNAERQAGKLWKPIFIVFGLIRPGIRPESTVSVADAPFTRPLFGYSSRITAKVRKRKEMRNVCFFPV